MHHRFVIDSSFVASYFKTMNIQFLIKFLINIVSLDVQVVFGLGASGWQLGAFHCLRSFFEGFLAFW